MLENIARSKEMKLVLGADNVKKNITFICHCCKFCCIPLRDMRVRGYPNLIVTSTFISQVYEEKCTGCGKCALACPVEAIVMTQAEQSSKKKKPCIDKDMCLGCGVCAQACSSAAILLHKRGQRIIHPETTFERIILQSLQSGKLVHQLFSNPQSITQKYIRGFLGAFLRLGPVRRGLLSDLLRSKFLSALKTATHLVGASKAWPE
jgi:ferredoxin